MRVSPCGSNPRISVVITCFNEGDALEAAVASVENQTDRDFELLVVNDASTDAETNGVCRRLEEEGRAKVIWREKNGGLSAARNSGYMNMSGDICVPLDGDDRLPPECVSTVREAFIKNPNAGYLFGNYLKISVETGDEQLVDCSVLASSENFMRPEKCLTDRWLLYGGSPCKKNTWERVGGYDEDFSYGGQDVDFWMKVFRARVPGLYINRTLYVWHRSVTGMNAKRTSEVLNKAKINEKNLETFDAFDLGESVRYSLMKTHLLLGDAGKSRRFAGDLLRNGSFSLGALAVFLLPSRLSRGLYQLRKSRPLRTINLW